MPFLKTHFKGNGHWMICRRKCMKIKATHTQAGQALQITIHFQGVLLKKNVFQHALRPTITKQGGKPCLTTAVKGPTNSYTEDTQ